MEHKACAGGKWGEGLARGPDDGGPEHEEGSVGLIVQSWGDVGLRAGTGHTQSVLHRACSGLWVQSEGETRGRDSTGEATVRLKVNRGTAP